MSVCGTVTTHTPSEGFLVSVESPKFALTGSPSRLSLHGTRICLRTSLNAWTPYSVRELELSSCVTPEITAYMAVQEY